MHDAARGPKAPRSTVLTPQEEAIAVASAARRSCRSTTAYTPCKPSNRT